MTTRLPSSSQVRPPRQSSVLNPLPFQSHTVQAALMCHVRMDQAAHPMSYQSAQRQARQHRNPQDPGQPATVQAAALMPRQ